MRICIHLALTRYTSLHFYTDRSDIQICRDLKNQMENFFLFIMDLDISSQEYFDFLSLHDLCVHMQVQKINSKAVFHHVASIGKTKYGSERGPLSYQGHN